MQHDNKDQTGKTFEQEEQPTSSKEQENKMAENQNPRANANIKQSSFEKEKDADTVGTEITDGEAG